jgi:23S rRNA (adenine2503-C2)-methyltransferase
MSSLTKSSSDQNCDSFLQLFGGQLNDEPAYRLKQIKQAIFKELITNWSQATTIPKSIRDGLDEICPLQINVQVFLSKDKRTVKGLITLNDGLKIETVLMRYQNGRNTVCVSSQVGCALGCSFCATGKMGFKRNLSSLEMVEQVLFFERYLHKEDEHVANVVFMGMGEPMLNYDNVMDAIRIMHDKDGLNIGSRRFSISTIGIVEGIYKLIEEDIEVNLAISLHAPNDNLRSRLMKINQKYPIKKILSTVDQYILATNRKVMFEYLMINKINDSDECARELAKLLYGRLCMVNLIAYNPTGVFKPSPKGRIQKFKDILMKRGIMATERYHFGQEIKAACGQLATQ